MGKEIRLGILEVRVGIKVIKGGVGLGIKVGFRTRTGRLKIIERELEIGIKIRIYSPIINYRLQTRGDCSGIMTRDVIFPHVISDRMQ